MNRAIRRWTVSIVAAGAILLGLPLSAQTELQENKDALRGLEREITDRLTLKAFDDLGLESPELRLNPKFAGRPIKDLIQSYQNIHGQVTGIDNRTDAGFEISLPNTATLAGLPVTPELQRNLAGVAAIVTDDDLSAQGDGFHLETKTYAMRAGVCADVAFAKQPVAARCTAFLATPRLMITAGHCEDGVPYSQMRFVFGFRGEGSFRYDFSKDDVYRGVGLMYKSGDANGDWAVVELDRDVVGREPIPIDRTHRIAKGDKVYMIGHPEGLPLKITGDATVNSVRELAFAADLDALHGNSGSPVFLEASQQGRRSADRSDHRLPHGRRLQNHQGLHCQPYRRLRW